MSFKRRLKRNITNKLLSRIKLEKMLKDTDYTLFKTGKLKCAMYKDKVIAKDLTNWRKVMLVIFSHSLHTQNKQVSETLSEVL